MSRNLGIKTSIVFTLVFANNTILSWFSLFFLTTDLYFLVPAVNGQIFYPNAELVMLTETPTNEANANIETHSLTAESKIRKC